MEYKYIISTECTAKGIVGKWYHGRFYEKPKQDMKPKTVLEQEKDDLKAQIPPVQTKKPDKPETKHDNRKWNK